MRTMPAGPSSFLAVRAAQRSHVLFVLSNAKAGRSDEFLGWYRNTCRDVMRSRPEVIDLSHYEMDSFDLTGGKRPEPAFRYLAIYDIAVDGAEKAEETIDAIQSLHAAADMSEEVVTWLYYPVSELMGNATPRCAMVTLAFANGVRGREDAFREWYVTQHIPHALNIPALASGQCFERTHFQKPGPRSADFQFIAVYEQIGTSAEVVEAGGKLSPGAISSPVFDIERFGRKAYQRIVSEG